MSDERYPIGKFTPVSALSTAERVAAIEQVLSQVRVANLRGRLHGNRRQLLGRLDGWRPVVDLGDEGRVVGQREDRSFPARRQLAGERDRSAVRVNEWRRRVQ